MTPAQFTRLRISAGLPSQQSAADFLCRSVRTVNGWENGAPIDPLAIKLLQLMIEAGYPPEDVGA